MLSRRVDGVARPTLASKKLERFFSNRTNRVLFGIYALGTVSGKEVKP